jgi:nitrite reductase/ring-hydroxylating ferredoxin subunit
VSDVRFIDVSAAADVPPGGMKQVTVEGREIAVYRVDGDWYATDGSCTHADFPLTDGDLDAPALEVECPLHGARFCLKTGEARCLPATEPLRTYPTKVADGRLLVGVPATS